MLQWYVGAHVTGSPLFVGWDRKVKRAFRGGSDSGDLDSNRDGWKDFCCLLLCWGCFLAGFFLKVWKRNISQSSWKAKEHDKQIGKTKPLFYSHSCAQRDFFLVGEISMCFQDVLLYTIWITGVFWKDNQQRTTLQGVLFWTISDSPTPTPPQKKRKTIQHNNIHLQISCVFHWKKRQWNFVSVVGVH